MQSSKAAGMGLFGGSSTDSVLGSGGAEILTKITAIFAIVFVLLAFSISYTVSKSRSKLDKALEKAKAEQMKIQEQQQEEKQKSVLPGLTESSNISK